MKRLDFAFIDLKIMDSSLHEKLTGVDNKLILKNISEVAAFCGSPRIVIRIPVLPGITDSPENLKMTALFLKKKSAS